MKRRSTNSIDYIQVESKNGNPYCYFVAMKEDTELENIFFQYHTDEYTGEKGWWINSTKPYPFEKLPKYVKAFLQSHAAKLISEYTTQGYDREHYWTIHEYR